MSKNKIRFQIGLSMPEFNELYGDEECCQKKLFEIRWPNGYECDKCHHKEAYKIKRVSRKKQTMRLIYQCKSCEHQRSLTAGTIFEKTKMPLTQWFLCFYLISQAKNSLSALELHRYLGVNYKTAWLMKQKIMQVMYEADLNYKLKGRIEIDDAYIGGKLKGGRAGRGSENKSPFIAAVETNAEKHPIYVRLTPISGFTSAAVKAWASANLAQGSHTVTDGLACFNALSKFGYHEVHVVSTEGYAKTDTHFNWVNTILSNVKTSLSGTFHSLKFEKYGFRYLADLQFRLNRRFDLRGLFESICKYASRSQPYSLKLVNSALSG